MEVCQMLAYILMSALVLALAAFGWWVLEHLE